jgi:hypothetical protein
MKKSEGFFVFNRCTTGESNGFFVFNRSTNGEVQRIICI